MSKDVAVLICIVNPAQAFVQDSIIAGYPHTFATVSSINYVIGNVKRLDVYGRPEKKLPGTQQ